MLTETVCLKSELPNSSQQLAREIYDRVCRTDFSAPGFCLVTVEGCSDSVLFRQLMVDLKAAMSQVHLLRTGNRLGYLSAGRFDQQVTTKFHLDGGPPECFLMLGYEPSSVKSKVEIADYSRCASDLGLTPQEFLERHNPMFQSGYDLLRPYITAIPCFSHREFQIVCINNSFSPCSTTEPRWQGTLHTAEILTPDDTARRVINSTMITPVEEENLEVVSIEKIEEFIRTSIVHRRGHDKEYLTDDR